MLKRVVNWNGDGFTWEAAPTLTEKLLNMLNVSVGKGALTPGGKDIGKDDRDVDCELECSDAKLVQAAVGLEQYIQTLRTASRQRYSRCRSPRSLLDEQSDAGLEVPVSTAAEEHRRVCGCRLCSQRDHAEVHVAYYGRSPIEFGSSTQRVRALSTGESEFYAITNEFAHSGVTVEAVVLSDASAGIGIASRQGCGRLKHLEVKWLWV